MKKVILYLWQLPQNLLGLAVILFSRAYYIKTVDAWYNNCRFGVSLGRYVIIDSGCSDITLRHERGHQKQSLYLGPLYLLLVGLPSALRNIYDRIAHKHWTHLSRYEWYYSAYPENWADRLGGVFRAV